jgi:hypothetical protein
MPARKSSQQRSAGAISPPTSRRSLPHAPWVYAPRALSMLVAGACITYGAKVDAGPLKGRIAGQEKLIPDVYVEAARPDSHRFTWREPSPTVRPEFRALSGNPSRDLCIAALSSAGAPTPAHDPPPVLVRITGGHTIPTTIVVAPGTRLSFENHDPFPHRLYVVGSPSWRAETIEMTGKRQWGAPPGPGLYEFHDELFPSVRTFVVVDPQVVDIAYPGRDGSFGLTLPAGDFVLKAYFGGKVVGRPVSVASKERATIELKDPLNVGEAADTKP